MNTQTNVLVKAPPIWKSRTFWTGIAVATLPVLEQMRPSIDVGPAWLTPLIGVLMIGLRLVTTQPVTVISEGGKPVEKADPLKTYTS